MERAEFVYTAAARLYQAARMRLAVEGMLGVDDPVDPNGLVDELVRRGWQVGINQDRPVELPAEYVVAQREGARHSFWADSADVGLVLALAAAVRDDDGLTPRHDEGGIIW